MNTIVILSIAIISYIILFFLRKKINFLLYELICAVIYLFSLSFIKTLDVTLVLYLIFSVLPYIKNFRIKKISELMFLVYFTIILGISVFINDPIDAVSIFIIRFIGIIFFICFFKNIERPKDPVSSEKQILKMLRVFAISEIFITVLACFILSDSSRLMLNYQCTVGNISIAGVLLVGYFLNVCKNNSRTTGLVYSAFFSIISIISGTRAYLIICCVLTFIYIILYVDKKVKLIGCIAVLVVILLNHNLVFNKFMEITRLDTGLGRRGSENLLVWKYMPSNTFNMFFGYGFGKHIGTLPNISDLIPTISNTPYTEKVLYNGIGEFHNFYVTVYYSTGLIGVFLTILLFASIIKNLYKYVENKNLKLILIAYVLLYMFISWYRWTATSGILEFATLAFIFINSKKVDEDKENSIFYNIKRIRKDQSR